MHLRHAAQQTLRRILRRYPFLRSVSLTTTILTLVWLYTIRWGERSLSASRVAACDWQNWEQWPKDAAPHHLVFIADPQLVDPHTYPGRPWPLSKLTETYTDMYMARNFRLINDELDPDSVVFLGDMFDGGREWATSRALPAGESLKTKLQRLSKEQMQVREHAKKAAAETQDGQKQKRSLESYQDTISRPRSDAISKRTIAPATEADSRAFSHGENGRWLKWGTDQWDSEFGRFGRIFLEPEQLYPHADRNFLAASNVETDPIARHNGAKNATWHEYGLAGGKHRTVLTSLPGNHDLGFGAMVQMVVRDRFHSHFGESNRVDVFGNHSFVSVDTPSLSAYSQFVKEGGETSSNARNELQHIWQPTHEFLNDLNTTAASAVGEALENLYPAARHDGAFSHEVIEAKNSSSPQSAGGLNKESSKHGPALPVVLLSHVPLFRNPDVDCGRFRERGKSISVSAGYQYQNVLTKPLSDTLIKKVATAGEIVHVFSGDDHDYCDVTHRFNIGRWNEDERKDKVDLKSIREITVKSFSWAMGVRLPGFQLVSLWNPVDELGGSIGAEQTTIQSHLCLLPDQLSTFVRYGSLLGVTLLILLLRAIIVGIRYRPDAEDDSEEDDDTAKQPILPRFRPRFGDQASGTANGYYTPKIAGQRDSSHGRQRASSTSTSTKSGNNSNQLSVQRSINARTRSVSPAPAAYATPTNIVPVLRENTSPLVERAGYYPQLQWEDPEGSDVESHVGDELRDSQAKWRVRRRPSGKVRRAAREFFSGLTWVAVPSGLFYAMLVRNG